MKMDLMKFYELLIESFDKFVVEWFDYSLLNNNGYYFMVEMFFCMCMFFYLMLGVMFMTSKNNKLNKYMNINNIFMNLFMFNILIILLLLLNSMKNNFMLFNGFYIQNNFIFYFKLLLLLFSLVFLFILKFYLKFNNLDFEFLIFIFISIFAMLLILSSNNFLSLYLSLELQNLCLYILVSFKQNSHFSTESGLKYFIIGSVSSGLLLFGISMIYGFTGLLNFNDMYLYLYYLNKSDYLLIYYILMLSFIFILISFLMKISLSPFHMWSMDVYYGANYYMTFFLMIIPKLMNIFILMKLLYFMFMNFYLIWMYLLYICMFVSFLMGTFGALYQMKMKKMLMYSMISNTGFFFIPFLIPNIESLVILIFYMLTYFFMNMGLFMCIFALKNKNSNIMVSNSFNLMNLFNMNPMLAFFFLILLFSISGLPPLLGFYSKLFLFLFCLKNKLYFMTLFAILVSVMNFFYYMSLMKLIFFEKNKYWFFFDNLNVTLSLILSFIIIFNLMFFIFPNPILLFMFKVSLYFYL